MEVGTGSSSPQENRAPQQTGSCEVLSSLLAAVVDFRRLELRKQLLSGVQAPRESDPYRAAGATADKILEILQRHDLPPEGLKVISSILACSPAERAEATLEVFRVVEKLIDSRPTAQEWKIVGVFVNPKAENEGLSDKSLVWAANEMSRKLGEDFEKRMGVLPATLDFVRLRGLINSERIPDAVNLLISRASNATNPHEVVFQGRDVLELAIIQEQAGNLTALPASASNRILQLFHLGIGSSSELKRTELALQRMAIAVRAVNSLAELYQSKGWDLDFPAAAISQFLQMPGLSKQGALSYESLVGEMVAQQRRVDAVLPLLGYVATRPADTALIGQFVSIMETFKKDAFAPGAEIPSALYPFFVRAQKPQIAHDFIRIALKVYEFQSEDRTSFELPQYLSNISRYLDDLRSLNATPVILTGLRKAIERGSIPGTTEVDKLMRHLVSHAAISVLVSAATPEEHRAAGDKLNFYYKNDSPPFPYRRDRVDPKAQTFLEETFRVIRRALDHMNGFGAHEFEARRPTRGGQSAIEEFFKDSGAQVQRLNSSSNDQFPGAGFMISGLDPERFLVADKRNAREPFWQYKVAWPWVGAVIPDLAGATLISSRGFHAVIPPASRKYCINARHYSYVVFNSHFENVAQHGAFLVPTRLLMKQLNGGTVPIEEYRGFSSEHRDVCQSGLTAGALVELGERAQMPVLNLSWPSNVGGLMRAFPANRPPYHQWEASKTTTYRDVAGHVHHSFIEGTYNSNLNSRGLQARLEPLIKAHGMVRDVADNLQALFTLFQYAEAAHSKGQFFPPNGNQPQEDQSQAGSEEGDAQMNPQAARKIRQSLEWYRRGEAAKHSRESYPVLALVPSAQLCPSPGQITPILDTVDFSTVVDGKKRYLLKELERDSWEQPSDEELSRNVLKRLLELHPQMAEVYTRMGMRMRLLHRDLVYQSKNPEGGDRHAQSSAST